MAKLYVICGHGAGDPGACANGYSEAERVRALGARIKALGGDSVVLLDTSRNWYADAGINSLSVPSGSWLIELHMDSASASAKGGHVIINGNFSADDYDKALAAFISGMFPGRSNTIVGRTDLANPNRAANRGINYRLLECCFITNSGDLSKFNSSLDAVAKGILAAFGIGASVGKPEWVKDDKGWWYRHADGSWPANQWEQIEGVWYWFDASGYAACNEWKAINDKWYLFDADCHMLTGWQKWEGDWYLLGENGDMQTGWKFDGDKWYYLDQDGDMAASECKLVDEKWYAFDSSGAMLEGSAAIDESGALVL